MTRQTHSHLRKQQRGVCLFEAQANTLKLSGLSPVSNIMEENDCVGSKITDSSWAALVSVALEITDVWRDGWKRLITATCPTVTWFLSGNISCCSFNVLLFYESETSWGHDPEQRRLCVVLGVLLPRLCQCAQWFVASTRTPCLQPEPWMCDWPAARPAASLSVLSPIWSLPLALFKFVSLRPSFYLCPFLL